METVVEHFANANRYQSDFLSSFTCLFTDLLVPILFQEDFMAMIAQQKITHS